MSKKLHVPGNRVAKNFQKKTKVSSLGRSVQNQANHVIQASSPLNDAQKQELTILRSISERDINMEKNRKSLIQLRFLEEFEKGILSERQSLEYAHILLEKNRDSHQNMRLCFLEELKRKILSEGESLEYATLLYDTSKNTPENHDRLDFLEVLREGKMSHSEVSKFLRYIGKLSQSEAMTLLDLEKMPQRTYREDFDYSYLSEIYSTLDTRENLDIIRKLVGTLLKKFPDIDMKTPLNKDGLDPNQKLLIVFFGEIRRQLLTIDESWDYANLYIKNPLTPVEATRLRAYIAKLPQV